MNIKNNIKTVTRRIGNTMYLLETEVDEDTGFIKLPPISYLEITINDFSFKKFCKSLSIPYGKHLKLKWKGKEQVWY